MSDRVRARENHPVNQKLEELFTLMADLGLSLEPTFDGVFLVHDRDSGETWELHDNENYGGVGNLPPIFEYKLTKEKP